MTKNILSKRILLYEFTGFGFVILFLWLNELIDIPHLILGAQATPINIPESIFETVIVLLLFIMVTMFNYKILKRLKYLEGFIILCSYCKKIRVEESWIPIEVYIRDHSEAQFSHSLCKECRDEHYGSILDKDRSSKI